MKLSTVAGPVQFEPNTLGARRPSSFGPGFLYTMELFQPKGYARRLMLAENFGYGVLGLEEPMAPRGLAYLDMVDTIPQQGDGSGTVNSVTASADGSRALVNWIQGTFGTFLMRGSGGYFDFAGAFGSSRKPSVAIVQVGARYIGFSASSLGLSVADVTSFSRATTTPSSIASERVDATVGARSVLQVAGTFVVYCAGPNVVVIDASRPGPAGAIASGLVVRTFGAEALGLPKGDEVIRCDAALHPTTGALYVTAETWRGGLSTGVGLAMFDGASLVQVGTRYAPPAPWLKPSPMTALVPCQGDLVAFFMENDPATNRWKLFALSAAAWGFAAGDVNGDGTVNAKDVLYLVNYVAAGGPPPKGSCDFDGDGKVGFSDVSRLIAHVFSGASLPSPAADLTPEVMMAAADLGSPTVARGFAEGSRLNLYVGARTSGQAWQFEASA